MEIKNISLFTEVGDREADKVNGGFYANFWGPNNTYFGPGSGWGASYRSSNYRYNPGYSSGSSSGTGSIYDSIYTYYS